jgi:alkylation response protein AidB-like acyl-CoA dehydrogenase
VGESAQSDQAAALRAELAALGLPQRTPGHRDTVMGAGSDDLEAGRAWLAALAPGGWSVPAWPAAVGGRDATAEDAAVIARELQRYAAPDLYPFGVGLSLVSAGVLAHGSVEQQQRWLPAIASGAEIWCQLFSEPDAGSDLASLSCRAVRDGETWRVTGQKVWSSRAHYAQWGLLLARTDPDAPKHAGITAFAVEMDQPGVEVRPLVQMNRDAHFNEVFLDDAVVADRDRIGGVGEGWSVARTVLLHERGAIGGGSAVSVERLMGLAATRQRAGDGVVRDRLAALWASTAVARWTRQRGSHGSLAKLALTSNLVELGDAAMDLLGPSGLVEAPAPASTDSGGDSGDWPTLFLTGPSFSIRGGTDEIQRNIVGERLLGLPRDP